MTNEYLVKVKVSDIPSLLRAFDALGFVPAEDRVAPAEFSNDKRVVEKFKIKLEHLLEKERV